MLTIGVPTYNRSGYLKKCLEAICSQIRADMPVEVLVSDNCSSDGTELLVDTYRKRCPQLRYVRQKENIGSSNNFRYIWKNAWGRFVLLIGDDDYLVPGAIEYILKAIAVDPDVALVAMKMNPRERRIYVGARGAAQYIKYISYFSTYISTLILRKEYIDIQKVQARMDSMGMSNTSLFQVALEMDVLQEDRKFTMVQAGWFLPGAGEAVRIEPQQYLEKGKSTGLADLGAIFIGEYFDILEAYIGHFPEVISAEKKKLFYEFILHWTELSAQKVVGWGAKRVLEYYEKYYRDEPYFEAGKAQLAPIVARIDADVKVYDTNKEETIQVKEKVPKDMKVVLLAGGIGTRISEESIIRPKPMIEIGGMPILWHIMKIYSHYGFNDFIICAGYKQYMIKEWFNNYFLYKSDVTFDFTEGKKVIWHEQHNEPWKVTVADTGEGTMTGGRIKRIQPYVGDAPFLMTYGDGVCDVDIRKLVEFHQGHGRLATLTTVLQEPSKGILDIGGDNAVRAFREKSQRDSQPINAGYMMLEPQVFDYLTGDDCVFERESLRKLAEEGQLMSYHHQGFWRCMDTLREKMELEKLWKMGEAPWKVWDK